MATVDLTEAQKLAPNWNAMSLEQQLSWVESELGQLMQSTHPWQKHGYEDLMIARMDMLLGQRKILNTSIETARERARLEAEKLAFTREVLGLRAKGRQLMDGVTSQSDASVVKALGKAMDALKDVG